MKLEEGKIKKYIIGISEMEQYIKILFYLYKITSIQIYMNKNLRQKLLLLILILLLRFLHILNIGKSWNEEKKFGV